MKNNILLHSAVALMLSGAAFTACTDDIAVGDASLDKATSSTATLDTVFNNAEYARQFLTGIYSKQYYGLPYINASTNAPHAGNPYAGKFDALTDCWHMGWNGAAVFGKYYNGSLTASISRSDGLDGPLFSFDKEYQWKSIRSAQIFIENIDRTPGITDGEKDSLKAEARCLEVSAFFETFQHYGGIPIIDHALEASETTNQFPRNSVDECVDWMINELNLAIPKLRWVTKDPATDCGRWTRAGARALKARIWQFAASPLLNPSDDKPYYDGASNEVKPYIMFTDHSKYQDRWDSLYVACTDFFKDLNANGYYEMTKATGLVTGDDINNPARYRLAYRKGYFLEESKEILHSVRVMQYDNFSTGRYCWHSWYTSSVPRNAYWPTEEYVEKFPYSDGEPFNWEKAYNKTFNADGSYKTTTHIGSPYIDMTAKSLHAMFFKVKGLRPDDQQKGQIADPILTRDPRLYEECLVNGIRKNLDWTTASMSGDTWELWANGTDGLTGVTTQANTMFGTGYGFNKYYLGDGTTSGGDNLRYQTQWVQHSLAEMYLIYAEALLMKSDVQGAANQINIVRSRVGLPGIENVWTNTTFRNAIGYKATTLTDAANAVNYAFTTINGVNISEFLEELLNERVRELGLTNARWFDMVRYKRTDWMTKQLHGLLLHRMRQAADGSYEPYNVQWANGDRYTKDASGNVVEAVPQPWKFSYELVNITGNKRVLWDKYDIKETNEVKKWLFDPLPIDEINKNYGLVQNPGWE